MENFLFGNKISISNNERKAIINWEVDETEFGPEFSASGEIYEDGKCVVGGQCLEEIGYLVSSNSVAGRIIDIWREYHLNGMTAGTQEQEEELSKHTYNRSEHGDYYNWACEVLKASNLYEVQIKPHTYKPKGGWPQGVENGERGYRYGERWLHRPLPDRIFDELKSLSNTGE